MPKKKIGIELTNVAPASAGGFARAKALGKRGLRRAAKKAASAPRPNRPVKIGGARWAARVLTAIANVSTLDHAHGLAGAALAELSRAQ